MIFREHLIQFLNEEILNASERARMISQRNKQPMQNNKFYALMLNRLGNILCSWDSSLQVRFGDQEILDSAQSMDKGIHIG